MFSWVWKITPKRPLIESKKDPFLQNSHILTPNRDSRESRPASKNNPFFRVSLVAHVYNAINRVPPRYLTQVEVKQS